MDLLWQKTRRGSWNRTMICCCQQRFRRGTTLIRVESWLPHQPTSWTKHTTGEYSTCIFESNSNLESTSRLAINISHVQSTMNTSNCTFCCQYTYSTSEFSTFVLCIKVFLTEIYYYLKKSLNYKSKNYFICLWSYKRVNHNSGKILQC